MLKCYLNQPKPKDVMADAIKDYQGANECVGIEDIDKYSDGTWMAQVKEDGMFVKTEFLKTYCKHESRWGLPIEGGSIEDGLCGIQTGVNAIMVGELEAASEYSTEKVKERGYRKIWYYDILELEGMDLRSLPLQERVNIMVCVLAGFPPEAKKRFDFVRMGFDKEGFLSLYENAAEGIMLKKKDSKYSSTRKSRKVDTWVKMKKRVSQSMVVYGFSRTKIGNAITARWALWNEKSLIPVLTAGFPGLSEENCESFVGRIADLEGFAVTKKGSLRSGQFEKWREDLSKEDCVFGQEIRTAMPKEKK